MRKACPWAPSPPAERFGSFGATVFGATTVADGEIRLVDRATGRWRPRRHRRPSGAVEQPPAPPPPPSCLTRAYRPTQRASLPVAAAATPAVGAVPAGWKADPTGRHQFRYWAGSQWTDNVADDGEQSMDAHVWTRWSPES